MAWSLIASGTAGGSADATVSNLNTVGADFFGVLLGFYTVVDPTADDLTDSVGNTYTMGSRIFSNSDTGLRAAWFWCVNPNTGASQSFTFTSPAADLFPGLLVYAFSGIGASPSIAQAGLSGTATSAQAGSLGVSGDLVLEGLSWYPNNGMSIDSGFSTPLEKGYNTTGGNIGVAAAWKDVTGAEDPEWTWSGSNFSAAVALAVTGGGGGAGQPTMRRWMNVPHMGGQRAFGR